MAAIDLQGLTKHFGDVVAVDDLDMAVEEGEVFGFLGPNGAGKSTTIDMLLDFVRPTAGSATVLGHDAQSESLAVRRRVGVLPDAFSLYDRLTGLQHVEFVVESKDVDDDPADVLKRVGITEAADRRAGGYSKGMRQRLALAMALVGDPDLLILDEPSTGLDPNGARAMRRLIEAENDDGTTVFFSSHILEQVEAVADRVGILHRGRLVAIDSVGGLRESMETEPTLLVTVPGVEDGDVETIRGLEPVESAALDGGRLRISVPEGRKLDALVAIEEVGYEVRDFSVEEASLEEIFASLTGEGVGA